MAVDDALQRIKADSQLRAILLTARSWGVSPRRFLGREPGREYLLVRDGTGQAVRLVEDSEPEWDEESRELAIAFAIWEADKCPGCGHSLEETTDGDSEFRYAVEATRCFYCTAIEMAAQKFESEETPQRSALLLHAELKPRKESLDDARERPGPGPGRRAAVDAGEEAEAARGEGSSA